MRARCSIFLLCAAVMAVGPTAHASAPEPEALPSFNESPGCDALYGVSGPLADEPGLIPMSAPVYGPWGDFYGRTIAQIHSQLVPVQLPGQSKTLYVHQRVLPAFQQVLANLAAEQAAGNTYPITSNTWSWSRYTISPTRKMSFHAAGAAIDVNSPANPYSADNVLITNMPDWFVRAWTDAGWCWGGQWQTIKDPMHFSWKGPIHTPGFVMPPPQPPLVAAAPFTAEVSYHVRLPRLAESDRFTVADIDRDGAADVVRLSITNTGKVSLHAATARNDFHWTENWGTTADAPTDVSAQAMLADLTADGRPDLVFVRSDGSGSIVLEGFAHTGGGTLPALAPITTYAPYDPEAVHFLDDLDRDGKADLFVVRPGSPATVEVWLGPGFDDVAAATLTAVPFTGTRFTIGDRDVDGVPDLYALTSEGSLVAHTGASGFTSTITSSTGLGQASEQVHGTDLDGDGHTDLMLVGSDGAMRLRRGGASSHHPGAWHRLRTHRVTRVGGDTRYATAAAISALEFPNPSGVTTAFVATGDDFPDALAGAAVAGRLGAPLLLTTTLGLPAVTRIELERLQPDRIVVLGGEQAVGPGVVEALERIAPVTRLAGATRYATAVEISRFGFPDSAPADRVVVAAGTGFADALAGSPAAVAWNGPLLLTEPGALPDVVRAEIERLQPAEIVLLGGTAVVSPAVEAELALLAPTRRIAGGDRYATSAALAAEALPSADRIFLATGLDFPDALAGAAAAAASGSPILLVGTDSVPPSVRTRILAMGTYELMLLGGPAAVSADVESVIAVLGM